MKTTLCGRDFLREAIYKFRRHQTFEHPLRPTLKIKVSTDYGCLDEYRYITEEIFKYATEVIRDVLRCDELLPIERYSELMPLFEFVRNSEEIRVYQGLAQSAYQKLTQDEQGLDEQGLDERKANRDSYEHWVKRIGELVSDQSGLEFAVLDVLGNMLKNYDRFKEQLQRSDSQDSYT